MVEQTVWWDGLADWWSRNFPSVDALMYLYTQASEARTSTIISSLSCDNLLQSSFDQTTSFVAPLLYDFHWIPTWHDAFICKLKPKQKELCSSIHKILLYSCVSFRANVNVIIIMYQFFWNYILRGKNGCMKYCYPIRHTEDSTTISYSYKPWSPENSQRNYFHTRSLIGDLKLYSCLSPNDHLHRLLHTAHRPPTCLYIAEETVPLHKALTTLLLRMK